MNCVDSLMQHALSSLWSPTLRQIGYLLNAKKNVEDVSSTMEDLKAKRRDIQKEIEDATREQKQSRHDVKRWLEKVGSIETEVTTIVTDFSRRGCLLPGGCSLNLWSTYRAGRLAAKKNAELEKLMSDLASLKDMVTTVPPVPVQEMPTTSEAVGKGFELNRAKILAYLSEENVGIVGIWGMGGVGKSFLLQAVNNALLPHACDGKEKMSFNHVIWVVASKELRLEKLQGDMAKRLGLRLPYPEDLRHSATTIFNYLQDKDFLLLLDDLWEDVNLTDIGIPIQSGAQHKRKVLFTTRSEEVCGAMHAQRSLKVECLKPDEAWGLFRENAGEAVDVNPIKMYAEKIVHECGGLPLALILLGRTMSIKKTPQEWDYALISLQKSRINVVRGMEEILLTLKYSYDSLRDDTLRECFLYCALWPEDANIEKEQLIKLWMGIGLIKLDDFDDIGEAAVHGHYLIGLLKETCFIEITEENEKECIKLHDVVRDLALWIGSECGKKKNKWIVRGDAKFRETSLEMEKWSSAERVSLMGNGIEEQPKCPPQCPNLLLLILRRNTFLKRLPGGFFQCMPALIYLDLSHTGLTELPRGINSLVDLQYLNLSSTNIASLPEELKSLVNLKHLLLRNTRDLRTLPSGLVSSLPLLQVLDLCPYVFNMDPSEVNLLAGRIKALSISVMSLEMLQAVTNVAIETLSVRVLSQNLTSLHFDQSKMWRGLRMLDISNCHKLEELVINGSNRHTNPLLRLEKLQLFRLNELKQISWRTVALSQCLQNLREVTVFRCRGLKHLNWVCQLPSLVELTVVACNGMEQLTGYDDMVEESEQVTTEEVAAAAFSRLRKLSLRQLPNLVSISSHTMAFPSLKTVEVLECRQLKKLPFRPETSKKLQVIRGDRRWWNGLEWDDDVIRSSISGFFISVASMPYLMPALRAIERQLDLDL